MPELIAVDGPAASGKSTLGEMLAKHLNYLFFDTGVMYRAITWAAMHNFQSVDEEQEVSELAARVQIDVRPPSIDDGRTADVLLDGRDITWQIRKPEVEANVSQVSAYQGVRKAMTEQQRRIGLRGRTIMVGRDIGTVVFPEAKLKLFMDASVEERARRRYHEVTARGEQASYEEILSAMRRRDQIDSTRKIAPLKRAEDAVIINTDNLCIEDVFQQVVKLIADEQDPQSPRE
jgi:cytidylate kinase